MGLPLLAGLSIAHALVPPHPAPTLAAATFHGDLGRTILYGLPVALLAGPGYALIAQRFMGTNASLAPAGTHEVRQEQGARPAPSHATVLTALPMPPILMTGRSVADAFLAAGTLPRDVLDFVGDPIMILLLALLYAMSVLGLRTGHTLGNL